MCWSANVQVWRHETARFKSYDRNVRRGHLFWEVLKESQHVRHDSSCQLCQAKPSVVERKMVTTTKSVCTLWALCCSGVCATGLSRGEMLTKMPEEIVLHAPFTPFGPAPGYEVNVSVIPALAAQAASTGVNTVWVAGTMGQFDSMTVAERKAIAEAWVTAAKSQSLYVIVNIGTTVRSEAIELAAHAAQIGADAIASVELLTSAFYTRFVSGSCTRGLVPGPSVLYDRKRHPIHTSVLAAYCRSCPASPLLLLPHSLRNQNRNFRERALSTSKWWRVCYSNDGGGQIRRHKYDGLARTSDTLQQ
eukprot:m.327981 g.327981  ORF g.327981 m.327981 type:complete len:305 (+) comp16496_c0_seq30:303-1217(+)